MGSEEKLFVRDGRAMSKAPFGTKTFALKCLKIDKLAHLKLESGLMWLQLIFPDSLLSFLLSPFGGRGIVHFGYYLASLVTMLQLLLRRPGGRMVLRETE